MKGTRHRSFWTSALTSSLEVTALWMFSLILPGPALVLARWVIGLAGSGLNFILNRRWAFRRRDQPAGKQVLRYAVTLLAAVTLSTLAFGLLLRLTAADPRVLHVTTMAAVWLVFTWPILHRWVFASPGVDTTRAA